MTHKKITEEQVANAKTSLSALAKNTKMKNLREAVLELYDEIKAALKEGANFEQIGEALSEHGIDISPATLRLYFYRANERKNKKSK